MTQLTNQTPAATYGDLLTTTNGGNGLSNILQNVQDGFGNNSPMQIALNAVNFNRTVGAFEIDSIAITSPTANINSVTQTNPVLPGNAAVSICAGTTAQRPGAPNLGALRYNTTIGTMEYWNGVIWKSF